MRWRTKLAVRACRMARWVMRRLGHGGTDRPGRLAQRINPQILEELSVGMTVVLVTGTNGKTTVCRMIEQGFREAGYRYICNRSGANLTGGIVAAFCEKTADCTHAVIECDEAAFALVSRSLKAQYTVVTNIFRDQLDRYGEIMTIRAKIAEGIHNLPQAALCLNADCSLTASLAPEEGDITWFGIGSGVLPPGETKLSDAQHCIFCKTPYEYDYRLYGHLGGFRCPHCGYRRPAPQVEVQRLLGMSENSTQAELKMGEETCTVTIAAPGGYNVSNAAAAAAALHRMGVSHRQVQDALANFECGFGRTEKLMLGQAQVRLLLVKNPTGFNQVIQYILQNQEPYRLVLMLNDRPADGTDISWIWDVDFEALARQQDRMEEVLTAGVRSAELMVRLKYAGFDMQRVQEIRELPQLLDRL